MDFGFLFFSQPSPIFFIQLFYVYLLLWFYAWKMSCSDCFRLEAILRYCILDPRINPTNFYFYEITIVGWLMDLFSLNIKNNRKFHSVLSYSLKMYQTHIN